ncbi:hypothetical protein ACLOJK_019610 [Asimina triloba]
MGAFCCCPCGEEFDDYAYPSNSIYRHCMCLRYFIHQLFSGYTAAFQRLEGRSIPIPVQGGTPLASAGSGTTLSDSSLSDAFHSVPRPTPHEADPRYSRLQRDGLFSRREKSLSHLQEESLPLRRSSSSSGVEHLGGSKKWNGVDFEGETKSGRSESLEKISSKASQGVGLLSEDEDVCPTCLDEYTPENPKIVTRCAHHFHLGCIYEWMERSDSCPLCGKEPADPKSGYHFRGFCRSDLWKFLDPVKFAVNGGQEEMILTYSCLILPRNVFPNLASKFKPANPIAMAVQLWPNALLWECMIKFYQCEEEWRKDLGETVFRERVDEHFLVYMDGVIREILNRYSIFS